MGYHGEPGAGRRARVHPPPRPTRPPWPTRPCCSSKDRRARGSWVAGWRTAD